MRETGLRRVIAVAAVAMIAGGCGGGGGDADESATDATTTAPTTTSSTTTTSTTTTTTTSTTTTTTSTTVPPPTTTLVGLDIGPIDDAYERLLEELWLSYTMLTVSSSDTFGEATSLQSGIWISDGGAETSIVVELDERSTAVLDAALKADNLPTGELENIFADGFRYRFFGDGLVWFKVGGEPWARMDAVKTGLDELEPLGDATAYLDPFLDAIVDVTAITPVDGDRTRLDVTIDADSFVPFVAAPQTSQNLFDLGWDGISATTIDGYVVVDAEGNMREAGADQTPWWQAGWDAIGASALFPDTTVAWTLALDTSEQVLDVPCESPVSTPDPAVGTIELCPA